MDDQMSVAMNIITWSGMAKTNFLQALELAKQQKFIEAEQELANGDENFKQAHKFHYETLVEEANEKLCELSLLLIHAEDQLMNTEMVRLLVVELIQVQKEKYDA